MDFSGYGRFIVCFSSLVSSRNEVFDAGTVQIRLLHAYVKDVINVASLLLYRLAFIGIGYETYTCEGASGNWLLFFYNNYFTTNLHAHGTSDQIDLLYVC